MRAGPALKQYSLIKGFRMSGENIQEAEIVMQKFASALSPAGRMSAEIFQVRPSFFRRRPGSTSSQTFA